MNNIIVYYQNRKNHLACTMFHPKYTNDFSKTHTKVYEGVIKDDNLESVFMSLTQILLIHFHTLMIGIKFV